MGPDNSSLNVKMSKEELFSREVVNSEEVKSFHLTTSRYSLKWRVSLEVIDVTYGADFLNRGF